MTTVTIYQTPEGAITGFDCEGHAGFGNAGEDIVCASVSTLVINTVNSIERFTEDTAHTRSDEEQARISLRMDPGYSHDSELLLRSMLQGLIDVSETCGAYLQILFEEV
jgi:uncharacterized protein YsxB (DUF464 family)